MMSSPSWPAWSIERNPADLARYVVPDEVARLVPIPGQSGEEAVAQLNTAWEALRAVGVGYVPDESSGDEGRLIRTPEEVLATPGSANSLDMAMVLAGACAHLGLTNAVLVLEPTRAGESSHALVAVLLGPVWPGLWQDVAASPETALNGLADHVRADFRLPGRDVVVLDPVGITHPLGRAATAGTDQSLDLAAAAGHAFLTTGQWVSRVGVVAQRRPDAFVPAQVPAVLPLEAIYRKPKTHESPLQLLRAEYEVTPFEPRDELATLMEICDKVSSGPGTGVVIMQGAGGCGKTRLALELAETLRRNGWYAGPLREELTATSPTSLPWLAKVNAPLLVVVDHADTRVGETQALLKVLQDRPGPPAVVLLSARSLDGDWLEATLGDQTATTHALVFEPLALPDVHPHIREVFASTFTAVRNIVDMDSGSVPGAEAPTLPTVSRAARWTTLHLVLFGWLAAKGTTDLPTSPGDVYDEVLKREMTYWARTFTQVSGDLPPNPDVLAQAGALITLLRPTVASADEALQVLRGRSKEGDSTDHVARTMTTCLDPATGEHLGIRPDLVGDHHLLKVLDEWPDLLHECLPPGTGGDTLLRSLLVLNRAGQNDGAAATRHLTELMLDEPARWTIVLTVASTVGGPAQFALERLVAAEECPLPLDELSARMPFGATGLRRLAMSVDSRRLRLADATDQRSRAPLLLAVSGRHGDAGDKVGALTAIEEAVTLYRGLVAAGGPTALTPDLAMALNNLSVLRSAAGDGSGALTAVEEAVTSYRELAEGDAAAFTYYLAMSLNNLSNQRSEAGDRAGALTAADEAATSYRKLAAGDKAAFTPDLAMALNNLSVRRWEVGDLAGALTAVEEAVTCYRELAAADPASFTHHLSVALNNLSVRHSEAGEKGAAVSAAGEAVTSYRELAAVDPAAFTPDLAGSLKNLSSQRSEAGDGAGALTAAEEAVTTYRQLVAGDPAMFSAQLAGALKNLSNQRSVVGDRAGALRAIEEAVTSYRELAVGDPAAFTPDLAMALNDMSVRRSETGDRPGALSAIEEAVTSSRELAAGGPAAVTPALAMALNNLSGRRSEAGDPVGALTAIEEAVTCYRKLAATDPAAFSHYLTASLNNLSNQRSVAGDGAGALSAIEEAVTAYRTLAGANQAAFTPDLAMALVNLSNQRSEAGNLAGSLTAAEEAVICYRELAGAAPAAFTLNLATSSRLLADRLADAGHQDRAAQALEQSRATIAVPLFRAYLTAATAAWRDRRGDRAEAETWIRQAVTEALDSAFDVSLDEPEADRGIPNFAVAAARQYVRSVAMSINPLPDGLPNWATGQIQDDDLGLARAWAGATTFSAAANALREHEHVATGQRLSETLKILVTLHPGDQRLTGLSSVHNDIVENGVDEVLAKLTAQDELQTLIKTWIDAETWAVSLDYLREQKDRLCTDEVFRLLAASQDPVAFQHAAILTLFATAPFDEVAELVTNATAAADLALDAVQAGNLTRVHLLTVANPHALQLPGTGLVLQAVLLLAAGDQDRAVTAAKTAARTATEDERHAHIVRLRGLAEHAEAIAGGNAGASALIDAYTPVIG